MSKQRLDDWEPDSIQVPVWFFEDYLHGKLNEQQAKYLLNILHPVYRSGEAVEDVFPEVPQNVDIQLDPIQEPKLEGDFYPFEWVHDEVVQRFPDVDVPVASARTIWELANGDQQWIQDVIDVTFDYHNTKYAVAKPIGFILSAIKRGNPEQARQQAQDIQKYEKTVGNSIIDQALETAKSRIKEPVPTVKKSRLSELTAKE